MTKTIDEPVLVPWAVLIAVRDLLMDSGADEVTFTLSNVTAAIAHRLTAVED